MRMPISHTIISEIALCFKVWEELNLNNVEAHRGRRIVENYGKAAMSVELGVKSVELP